AAHGINGCETLTIGQEAARFGFDDEGTLRFKYCRVDEGPVQVILHCYRLLRRSACHRLRPVDLRRDAVHGVERDTQGARGFCGWSIVTSDPPVRGPPQTSGSHQCTRRADARQATIA